MYHEEVYTLPSAQLLWFQEPIQHKTTTKWQENNSTYYLHSHALWEHLQHFTVILHLKILWMRILEG